MTSTVVPDPENGPEPAEGTVEAPPSEDDTEEPEDHAGDEESDPEAVDPDHTPDTEYREAEEN